MTVNIANTYKYIETVQTQQGHDPNAAPIKAPYYSVVRYNEDGRHVIRLVI